MIVLNQNFILLRSVFQTALFLATFALVEIKSCWLIFLANQKAFTQQFEKRRINTDVIETVSSSSQDKKKVKVNPVDPPQIIIIKEETESETNQNEVDQNSELTIPKIPLDLAEDNIDFGAKIPVDENGELTIPKIPLDLNDDDIVEFGAKIWEQSKEIEEKKKLKPKKLNFKNPNPSGLVPRNSAALTKRKSYCPADDPCFNCKLFLEKHTNYLNHVAQSPNAVRPKVQTCSFRGKFFSSE